MRYDIFSWIAYAVASAVFLIVVFSYYSAIFNKKYSRTITYSVGVFCAFVNLILPLVSIPILNMVVTVLSLIVIAQLFSGKLLNRLVFTIFLFVASVISDFIVALAITLLGNVSPDDIHFGTPAFIIGLMLSRTQFAIIAKIISRIAENRKLPPISKKRWIIFIALPIGSLLVLYNFLFQRNHSPLDVVSSIVVMAMTVVTLTVYGKIISDYESEIKSRYLEEVVDHLRYQYSMAEESEKLILKTKHDIKNLLLGFQSGLQSQNVESVQKGITELLGEIESYEGPANSGNLTIDSIINYKFGIAKESQILFFADLKIPNNLNLNSVVACQIIGSALDNAIEATEKIENVDERIVEITVSFEQGILLIKVVNPYKGNIIINTKGGIMSSKRNYRSEGIGLQSIASAALENGGTYDVNYSENKFSLSVMIFDVMQANN